MSYLPPLLSPLIHPCGYKPICMFCEMTLVTEHPELRKEGNNYFLQYCLVK